MAVRYFVNGGTNSLWSNTHNWSLTSGGTGGQTVPTNVIDVMFDQNSPKCTIDAIARNCKGLTFSSGFTQSINFVQTLNIFGNLTLSPSMSFIATSSNTIGFGVLYLRAADTTITSNGKSIDVPFQLSPYTINHSIKLVGDLSLTKDVSILSAGFGTFSIIGNDLYIYRNLPTFGACSITGTSKVYFVGTSSSIDTVTISNDVIINKNGDLTLINFTYGTNLDFGGTAGTLTYLNGTVSLLSPLQLTTDCTLNTNGLTWSEIDFNGSNITLLSSLQVGTFSVQGSTTFFNSSFYANNLYLYDGCDLTLDITNEYFVDTLFVLNGLASGAQIQSVFYGYCSLNSSTPGTQALLTIKQGTIQDIMFCNVTDIDSSRGITLWGYNSIYSNTSNWNLLTTQVTKSKAG